MAVVIFFSIISVYVTVMYCGCTSKEYYDKCVPGNFIAQLLFGGKTKKQCDEENKAAEAKEDAERLAKLDELDKKDAEEETPEEKEKREAGDKVKSAADAKIAAAQANAANRSKAKPDAKASIVYKMKKDERTDEEKKAGDEEAKKRGKGVLDEEGCLYGADAKKVGAADGEIACGVGRDAAAALCKTNGMVFAKKNVLECGQSYVLQCRKGWVADSEELGGRGAGVAMLYGPKKGPVPITEVQLFPQDKTGGVRWGIRAAPIVKKNNLTKGYAQDIEVVKGEIQATGKLVGYAKCN